MKTAFSVIIICVFSFISVFAATPFSIRENQIPELKKEGRYRLIALYYYYAAAVSSDRDLQLTNIKKAVAILPENGNSEDRALLGMLNVYRSQFYTGGTRTYYLSIGVLSLNKSVREQPDNLRLRFMRLLSFSHLPLRYYNVNKYLRDDRDYFHSMIEKEGIKKVNSSLSYLYYRQWGNLLRGKYHE